MKQIAALPRVEIGVGGGSLPRNVMGDTLVAVRVWQRLSLPAMVELVFAPSPAAPLAAHFQPGLNLRVGLRSVQPPLFEGEVTAVEHAFGPAGQREVRVRGYDALHRLQKRQEVRTHVQVKLPELARQFVGDLGISVRAAEEGPLWHRLIQHRESDLALLNRLASRAGLYLTLRERTLHVLTLEGLNDPAVALTLGDTLLEARVRMNGAAVCESVAAAGWDPWRAAPHHGRSAAARVGRSVGASVSPDGVGATAERLLVDEVVQDDPQAEALAQAEMDARAAHAITLIGVAEGDPRLRPGTPIDVAGLDAELDGQYVLTEVTHSIDAVRGFTSELDTTPPPPPARARGAVVAVGEVQRTDDPDKLGRVQVSLPTYSDAETDWMSVVVAGAGSGKGMVALPEVGDTVLVLFVGEDPAQGVVLGGLYGVQGLPGEERGGNGRAGRPYTFLTPGGQRVRLDDAKKSLRLENSEGSYMELSPEELVLHAETDLRIEAPGRSVAIRGAAINFEQA